MAVYDPALVVRMLRQLRSARRSPTRPDTHISAHALFLCSQTALADHVIPRLPDVTQIPDDTWPGWEPVLQVLQVDTSNEAVVRETVARCQTMLQSLLQDAMTAQSLPQLQQEQQIPQADTQVRGALHCAACQSVYSMHIERASLWARGM
jgi:hypothetical protein